MGDEQLPRSAAAPRREPAVTSALLSPIPGEVIDPPVKVFDSAQQMLDDRHAAAGVMFRAWHRFVFARATLLAAGTTYFLFLSLISLAIFGYGVVALIGADVLAEWLAEGLNNAFPGLTGEEGISPESIRGYGTTASIGGLLILGVAGTSAINAANQSLHILYGAPKDPRNIVVLRIKMLGQLCVLGPLVLMSFIPSLLITTIAEPLRDALDIEGSMSRNALLAVTVGIALLLDYSIIRFLLGRLGGIRPPKRALRIGAWTGAVVVELLKYAMAGIIGWSLSKPEYGAFAAPITFLLVMYLLSIVLYAAASLTAAVALKERDDLHAAAGVRSGPDGDPRP